MLKSHYLKYRVNDYVDSQFVKLNYLTWNSLTASFFIQDEDRDGPTDLSLLLIIYTIDYKNVSPC